MSEYRIKESVYQGRPLYVVQSRGLFTWMYLKACTSKRDAEDLVEWMKATND